MMMKYLLIALYLSLTYSVFGNAYANMATTSDITHVANTAMKQNAPTIMLLYLISMYLIKSIIKLTMATNSTKVKRLTIYGLMVTLSLAMLLSSLVLMYHATL